MYVPGEDDLGCSWNVAKGRKVVTCALVGTTPSYRATVSELGAAVYLRTKAGRIVPLQAWRNERPARRRPVRARGATPGRRYEFPPAGVTASLAGTDILCKWTPAFDGHIECSTVRPGMTYGLFLTREQIAIVRHTPGQLPSLIWAHKQPAT
jgi:hypothetical protein